MYVCMYDDGCKGPMQKLFILVEVGGVSLSLIAWPSKAT